MARKLRVLKEKQRQPQPELLELLDLEDLEGIVVCWRLEVVARRSHKFNFTAPGENPGVPPGGAKHLRPHLV